MDEEVDVLEPPFFKPSGVIKPREQAYDDGDWIGTFNLWIVRRDPEPAILYQQRSLKKLLSPGLLDVTAGGRYAAGELLADGLREVKEELGVSYNPADIINLGKKMYVGVEVSGRKRNEVVDVFMVEDGSDLSRYTLQEEEVEAVSLLPISELLKVHREEDYKFEAVGINNKGKAIQMTVSKPSFPQNFDNYHYKMAVLADHYFRGEKDLLV